MKRRVFLLALTMLPGGAMANDATCIDLWILRNTHFDRAGYCFRSALGKAVFDNSDCTARSVPDLPARAAETVREMRDFEQELSCKINTKGKNSQIISRARALRTVRAMQDIPVPDFLSSACLGYRGTATALRAGHGFHAPSVAPLRQGDRLIYSYFGTGGWLFAENMDTGVVGWMPAPAQADCDQIAG